MKSNRTTTLYEFGTLYIKGQRHKPDDVALDEKTFDNLWNYILSKKANSDVDAVMSVHTRQGQRYIKAGRYVGTIQTKNGHTIEILPKIFINSQQNESDKNLCRAIFLRMLCHFTDAKTKSFQNASLNTRKGFPILEVYIDNYIQHVKFLLNEGLRKDYVLVNENQRFLKGRLDTQKNIIKNISDRSKFVVEYGKYIENIPHNRIIATTLRKLLTISKNSTNVLSINNLLISFSSVPNSKNIERDIELSSTSNKLYTSYYNLIIWSKQFLFDKGFTAFSGNYVNQSLLFRADRLFEDFISYLFKKYGSKENYSVVKQDVRYFLVDKHKGKGFFRIKPDIYAEKEIGSDYRCVIIDAKWKSIDAMKPKEEYLIDIKDMYQLYAYGQKYGQNESSRMNDKLGRTDIIITPKLVLLYPYTEHFTDKLDPFIYEQKVGGLIVEAIPFKLDDVKSYEEQVKNILGIDVG